MTKNNMGRNLKTNMLLAWLNWHLFIGMIVELVSWSWIHVYGVCETVAMLCRIDCKGILVNFLVKNSGIKKINKQRNHNIRGQPWLKTIWVET